ncbi:MAG: response regulator [Bacteroidales bacterium]|nr:response regulator [Bacteroidales bacterium]
MPVGAHGKSASGGHTCRGEKIHSLTELTNMPEKHDITLLLVEDDKVIRNVYAQLLSQIVLRIVTASNGEEGYEAFLKHSPDLILTDIKMPVMNGLDMINKIKVHNNQIRVIIMSAYGESRFFLKAIESGVKGFLTKPINNSHLQEIILAQVKDILLEKNFHKEELKRQLAEAERDRSENILKILSMATATFFQQGVNDITVDEVLSNVGTVTQVSRVYIFKTNTHKDQQVISQIYEWVAEGIESQLDNSNLVNIPVNSGFFLRWRDQLVNRKMIITLIKDIENEGERDALRSQSIKSIIAIPIFVKDEWWGFIGLDDCIEERNWSEAETNALEMLAFNLGGAIYRRNVEDELTHLNYRLEERVKERTIELEQEVQERTLAELLLGESEQKYRHIYENANDGIILIKKGVIVLINPRVTDIFRLMPREIIGRNFADFFLAEYKPTLNTLLTNEEDTELSERNEITIEMQGGRWIEMKTTFIEWDNEPANLAFISDVSKRKQAENNLFKLNEQLEIRINEEIKRVEQQQQLLVQKSKLESIGELLAGLAHEINQPLGGISMGIENIQFKLLDRSLNNEYLESKINLLYTDIDRIRNIINHVRVFSRDQEKLEIETVDIVQGVNNALSMVSRQFEDHQVDLRICIPDQKFLTRGNNYRLEQVLLNLLSNAKYAVEERAREMDPLYVKMIMISLEEAGGDNVIVVEDNGTGIDKNVIPNIFNPFYTTKSEDKGTGLGLSISYGIVKEMKGTITVESELNKFTRIIITLPK